MSTKDNIVNLDLLSLKQNPTVIDALNQARQDAEVGKYNKLILMLQRRDVPGKEDQSCLIHIGYSNAYELIGYLEYMKSDIISTYLQEEKSK